MADVETSKTGRHEDIGRFSIEVGGIVQGVGFRPFIHRFANRYGLSGWVCNSSQGVVIEVEGERKTIEAFLEEIKKSPPVQAHIEKVEVRAHLPLRGYRSFEIRESLKQEGQFLPISPDIGTCEDCLRELFDFDDRRYRYPFINCTNCGPRFTITRDIPYDRENTTMESFSMCPYCLKEYQDPLDRRFHAQPNACPDCGPQLMLWDHHAPIKGVEPVEETIKLLREGYILGIKGLGGFHLACDAENHEAVEKLRRRKHRTSKPFAIMSFDLQAVRQYCYVIPDEERLLTSSRRPVLLLLRKSDSKISPLVAPHNHYLGVMLPYTPLHYLLLKDSFLALVMTSGNLSEEPIVIKNQKAIERLAGVADFFLMHDRDIHLRCDDSVAWVEEGRERLIRRSRGFAPEPLHVPIHSAGVLACGAELKNTFCLSKDHSCFISQHIGDLANLEAYQFFGDSISHYQEFFRIDPLVVAHDLHPDYLATRYAKGLKDKKLLAVQHHHAHIASCMAENGLNERVIGIAFDGTGLGIDGKIWGGEFLTADYAGFERWAHLRYTPMPGGDAAIRHPYRMALSFLYGLLGKDVLHQNLDFFSRLDRKETEMIIQQTARKFNSPLTSSCGRLFDAVSSLIGIRDSINYEGQAAIELEMAAEEGVSNTYPWNLITEDDQRAVDTWEIIMGILGDLQNGISASTISSKFHQTVASFSLAICEEIRNKEGLNKVVLSGGVFQNRTLLKEILQRLREKRFEPFFHQRVPTNDGGISLGQAVIAARSLHDVCGYSRGDHRDKR
jgi:hydrogenase maturation protein HypF